MPQDADLELLDKIGRDCRIGRDADLGSLDGVGRNCRIGGDIDNGRGRRND